MRLPGIMRPQCARLAPSALQLCACNHHKCARHFNLRAWFSLWIALCLPQAAYALNNCLATDFQDRHGQAEIQIANDNPGNPFIYRPRCVTISEGTRVHFVAVPDFGMHPLYGGTVSGGQANIDPDSPIGSFTSGDVGERVLTAAGEFPFFCDFHFAASMMGSIRVIPQLFADGFD